MFPSSNKVSFQHHNFKGTLRKTTSTPLGKKKKYCLSLPGHQTILQPFSQTVLIFGRRQCNNCSHNFHLSSYKETK